MLHQIKIIEEKGGKRRDILNASLIFLLLITLLFIARNFTGNSFLEFREISYFIALISVTIAAVLGGSLLGMIITFGYLFSANFFFISSNSLFNNNMDSLHAATFLTESIFISLLVGQIKGSQKKSVKESINSVKNEQRLREVLDSLFVYVGVLDKNGMLLETNKTAINSANLKFKDVIGKPFSETYWWSYSEESKNRLNRAIQEALNGEEIRYDTTVRLKDNNLITMDFALSPIKDKNNKIQYLVASGVDIDYRTEVLRDNIKLYKKVRHHKKIIDNIISNIPGTVIQLSRNRDDEGFRVSYINKYAERVFGYKIGECKEISDLWFHVAHPDDRYKLLKDLELIYKNQKSKTCEFRCVTKSGKVVWVEARFGINIDEDGGQTIDGVIMDISDRIKVEQIKDEFMNIASHEIKTPLTTIKAFGQMLMKKLNTSRDKESIKYINKMDSYIFKLNQVVNDFLDFSKIKSGQMEYYKEKIDYGDLVKSVVEDMQAISEKHKIILIGKCNPQIIGDKTRLSQVIINLISNAIKYSPEADKVIVNIKKEEEKIITNVKDFGIGIPKENRKNVFSKFYRAKNPKQLNIEGFGLGLYISSEIIKRHGGKMWLESEESKGSTFYFSLPTMADK